MANSIYQQLLDLKGSSAAVKRLVREAQDHSQKAKSEINVSGTKSELIDNLRTAVSSGYLEGEQVRKLLWDTEEAGRQHILLLRLGPEGMSSPSADPTDPQAVSLALFDDVDIDTLFPRYEYPTHGYMWSDFRFPERGGWLGKAYGLTSYRQSQGLVSTEEMEDGTIQEIRQYTWKEVKTTLLARWRPVPGILELRIDNSNLQNKTNVEDRRNELWALLKPAFAKADLIGVDVGDLLQNIIFNRETSENRERYSISRVELTDPRSGSIRVIPKGSEELDHDPGRKASLEAMRKNSFLPSLVRVEWKAGIAGCPPCMTSPVSVVVEKTANGPEVRILKKISIATYEYIFNQLRIRL